MHFNVKNVLQLDEALHELPIHDSGITSIENEVPIVRQKRKTEESKNLRLYIFIDITEQIQVI